MNLYPLYFRLNAPRVLLGAVTDAYPTLTSFLTKKQFIIVNDVSHHLPKSNATNRLNSWLISEAEVSTKKSPYINALLPKNQLICPNSPVTKNWSKIIVDLFEYLHCTEFLVSLCKFNNSQNRAVELVNAVNWDYWISLQDPRLIFEQKVVYNVCLVAWFDWKQCEL